jgi:cephalosporin hydroxylase
VNSRRVGAASVVPSTDRATITIDPSNGTVTITNGSETRVLASSDPEAFRIVSDAWLRVGWSVKHVYSFAWLGRPVIQLPEDLIRVQEVLFAVQPDVIVETGVAHGGSAVFYASLCRLMGKGRVIAVDVEIREHNRKAIESHPLADLITLIDGDSVSAAVVDRVAAEIKPSDTVFAVLDSNHTKAHVAAELKAYSRFVTPGSYVLVMDGIMGDLCGAERTKNDWCWNNPREAALEFVAGNPDFEIVQPPFPFNEGAVSSPVTYSPSGYVKRIR